MNWNIDVKTTCSSCGHFKYFLKGEVFTKEICECDPESRKLIIEGIEQVQYNHGDKIECVKAKVQYKNMTINRNNLKGDK